MAKYLTYEQSGVSIDANDTMVERIRSSVQSTFGPRVLDLPGGFAGMFRLDYNEKLFRKNYKNPILVACTDGAFPHWRFHLRRAPKHGSAQSGQGNGPSLVDRSCDVLRRNLAGANNTKTQGFQAKLLQQRPFVRTVIADGAEVNPSVSYGEGHPVAADDPLKAPIAEYRAAINVKLDIGWETVFDDTRRLNQRSLTRQSKLTVQTNATT